jgi:hypothetical protein
VFEPARRAEYEGTSATGPDTVEFHPDVDDGGGGQHVTSRLHLGSPAGRHFPRVAAPGP